MTKTHNILKLNGKSYDAISGQVVHGHAKTIDGFVRPAAVTAPATKPLAVPQAPQRATAQSRPVHKPAPAAKARTPHASRALMRQAVKKPTTRLKSNLKIQTRTDAVVSMPELAVVPKLSIPNVDIRRATRAKHIARSNLISRFEQVRLPAKFQMAAATVPVAHQLPTVAIATPTHNRPQSRKPQGSGSRSMDIFQHAMKHADSHKHVLQAAHHMRRAKKQKTRIHRLATIASASLAVLLLAGFFVYQNSANLTMRLAASRAGFAASLPGYRPSGFSVGKFAYSPGHVNINFVSNSDPSRRFALKEQPSNWDSTTLLNDFVATSEGQAYQTVQTAGRTIYLYGNGNATWVNDNVWYQVSAGNSLSTTQLIDLANSM